MGMDGNWKLKVQTPMGEMDWNLEIKVAGDTVGGTLTTTTDTTELEEGTIDGNQLSWVSTLTQPRKARIRGTAEFDGDKVSGEIRMGAFVTRSFSGSHMSD
jgi:hypothetical protein